MERKGNTNLTFSLNLDSDIIYKPVYDHTYRWYFIISKLHTNCTKEPTPSAHNPACKELLDSVGDDINLETPGARIKLVIENQSRSKGNSAKLSKRKKDNRKKSTSCYTNLDQHHGWCATNDMDNLTMDTSIQDIEKNKVGK